nr:hypothetical protein [Demequina litorisediminis]
MGRDAARFLQEAGVTVVAVSDVDGAVINERGLDVTGLAAHVDATGSVRGFERADEPGPRRAAHARRGRVGARGPGGRHH